MADTGGYPMGAVLGALNAGLTASAGLHDFRAGGGEVRTQSWYRLWGEAQQLSAAELAEAAAPLNRLPTGGEVTQWSTSSASGFMQRVGVFTRDRSTGEVEMKFWASSGAGVVSRRAAMDDALAIHEANADDYDEQVLGAVYLGTHELVPGP